jgi:hypothetical protein
MKPDPCPRAVHTAAGSMPDDHAGGITRRTVLLVVVVAAAMAYAAGQYTERHGGSWQLLPPHRQRSLMKDVRLASTSIGSACRHEESSDGQWCWVKVKCDASAARQPSGLGTTSAAASVDQQQQTASAARSTNGQQIAQAAAPEAGGPEPEAAGPPQPAQPVSAAQDVSRSGRPDKQEAEQKPLLDVVGEPHALPDVGT